MSQHFQIRQTRPGRWDRMRPVLRGCVAVAVLLLTAVDALLTAVIGVAPLTPRVRVLARVVADEYRVAHHGAVDAEVIDTEVIDTEVIDTDDEDLDEQMGRCA